MKKALSHQDRFRGILLGTAVGDALGLPAEGISRKRIKKLFAGHWHHHHLLPVPAFISGKTGGWGMISDDTEHTVFVAQSLLAHPDSPEIFAKRFSRCLRWWLMSLPAGIGWATLRAILRLWIGISPLKSGVYSAGNGPAMRSAVIGAFFAYDFRQLDSYLEASTRITHTDPRALTGAKAVAYLTAFSFQENLTERPDADTFINLLRSADTQCREWNHLMDLLSDACKQNFSVEQFADELGLSKGVTGYMYHTVPIAVYAWYKHFGNFEQTLSAVLNCGGDTDTTGAIVGALTGAVVGEQGIPEHWINGIWEFPRSINVLRKIADMLALRFEHQICPSHADVKIAPVRYFVPAILFRNMLFLSIVLLHGVRRLFPPY